MVGLRGDNIRRIFLFFFFFFLISRVASVLLVFLMKKNRQLLGLTLSPPVCYSILAFFLFWYCVLIFRLSAVWMHASCCSSIQHLLIITFLLFFTWMLFFRYPSDMSDYSLLVYVVLCVHRANASAPRIVSSPSFPSIHLPIFFLFSFLLSFCWLPCQPSWNAPSTESRYASFFLPSFDLLMDISSAYSFLNFSVWQLNSSLVSCLCM